MRALFRVSLVICLSALASSTPYSRKQESKGWFSRPERVPEEIIEKHEDFNIVRYKETKWVCTKMVADIGEKRIKKITEESADSVMFNKLFMYISGGNSDSVEIEMTSPVTTLRKPVAKEPAKEEMEMCFWTGSPWQDKELPTPNDKDVYLQKRSSMEVFVRRFGGFVWSRNEWMEHKQALEKSLAGRTDVDTNAEDGFYTVGYDSPFKPFNRRNEIWMLRKPAEAHKQTKEENLETPEFTVISENEKFELREYPATKWVCTKMMDIEPSKDPMNGWEDEFENNPFAAMSSEKWEEQPSSKMFSKLFAYIAGFNQDHVQIPMTSPVSHLHDPTGDAKETQEMCFWLGTEWHDSSPQPLGKDVYIQHRLLTRVYVRKFGGFALSYDDFNQHYEDLKKDLSQDPSIAFDNVDGRFFQISYDSPFVIKNRHNEVWILEKTSQ